VGIKDDLIAAQEAVKDIITWERALELICASQRVTKIEAARWLILKQADRTLKSYFLTPSIPLAEEHAENNTTAYLQDIVSPSMQAFIDKFRLAGRQTKHVALNINDLDAFLQHEGIPSILQEERESDTNPIASNQENESLPQKRQRMILEALSGDNGYANIKELPTGAKRKLKDELLKDHPKIFTDSTFDKSWTETSAQGLIGLADKEKFKPKANAKG